MQLKDITVVLSRPEDSGNIGAVCRAMKNCGLVRLRLVRPWQPKDEVIRTRAVHAADLWDKAEVFDALAPALEEFGLAVGLTRRRGQGRGLSMLPEELACFLRERSGTAALVFGNESSGLDDEELALCNISSHIPTSPEFPSLNLSHAVQVLAYELFRALGEVQAVEGQWVPLDRAGYQAAAHNITQMLAKIGFYKQTGPEDQEKFFRDIFARAGLSQRECNYFRDIFAKTARLGMGKHNTKAKGNTKACVT